jgi:hypothetical protein
VHFSKIIHTKKSYEIAFYRSMVWYKNLTTGMAFVDELIHLNQDLTVILVDKRAQPGGHWGSFFSIKID